MRIEKVNSAGGLGDPVEVSSCGEMGGGGGGGSDGRSKELERLRAERDELDARIRLLESELEAGSAAPVSPEAGVGDGGCVGGGGACQARPGLAHDDSLPADMIDHAIRLSEKKISMIEVGKIFSFTFQGVSYQIQPLCLIKVDLLKHSCSSKIGCYFKYLAVTGHTIPYIKYLNVVLDNPPRSIYWKIDLLFGAFSAG